MKGPRWPLYEVLCIYYTPSLWKKLDSAAYPQVGRMSSLLAAKVQYEAGSSIIDVDHTDCEMTM